MTMIRRRTAEAIFTRIGEMEQFIQVLNNLPDSDRMGLLFGSLPFNETIKPTTNQLVFRNSRPRRQFPVKLIVLADTFIISPYLYPELWFSDGN